MSGPADQIRALLAHGDLSPAVRARGEAKLRELEAMDSAQGPAAPGPGGVQVRQAGEAAPPVDPLLLREKLAAEQAPMQTAERLPTAYIPTQERGVLPIMYQEQRGDEGWKAALEQGEREGRRAYRVEHEFPWDPREGGANALLNPLLRGSLRLGAMALGGDEMQTGGAAKLVGKAAESLNPDLYRGAGQNMRDVLEANPIEATTGRVAGALNPRGLAGRIGGAFSPTTMPGSAAAGLGLGAKALGGAAAGYLGGSAMAGATGLVDRVAGGDADPQAAMDVGGKMGMLLGPLAPLLGAGASRMRSGLRNPNQETGRQLLRAERGGAQITPTGGMRQAPGVAALEGEGRALGGVAPADLAAERAAGVLGDAVESNRAGAVSKAAAQNEAGYEVGDVASMMPLMRKGLQELRDLSHSDGTSLPGTNARQVAQRVKETAEIQVVPRSSDIAHAADPQDMMDVGLARKLGLIGRGGSAQDNEMVAVLEPRIVGRRQMDTTVRALTEQSKAAPQGGPKYSAAAAPLKHMAAEARANRGGFGEEWQATKAEQAESLSASKDIVEAAGLPRSAERINPGEFGTREALFRAVQRYGTKGNIVADRELNRLADIDETGQLRGMLDEAAGAEATGALQSKLSPRIAFGQGVVPGIYSAGTRARFALDPIMGALQGGLPPGALPATAAEVARHQTRRPR